MLRKKQGYPESDELLLCTVTKIHHHSVFVHIDEYDKSGMIHISEISPGRIRNIRDFVVEGKVVVCKVLRIDEQKGHIDLSLRRVNDNQKRQKVDEVKQEQVVEKIIEFIAKQNKTNVIELYEKITKNILKKYDSLYSCFEDIVSGDINIEDFVEDKKIASQLKEVILLRIKPKEVEIRGDLLIKSYDPEGVEIVKEILKKTKEKGNEKTSISYMAGGKYRVVIKAPEYKEAEKVLVNMTATATKMAEKKEAEIEFIRR